MKNSTKWTIGIVIGLIVLFALPFVWQLLFPAYSGYGMGMMRGVDGYGLHAPMMGYGFGFLPFGMFFMWLIPLGTLVFLGLGIAWLVKQLTAKKPE
ncbi:MAG: hypothetical protein MUO77_05730 [Anaerolineales bacterium]|nr:hypothetical protein [Anaerolineales bacterium]